MLDLMTKTTKMVIDEFLNLELERQLLVISYILAFIVIGWVLYSSIPGFSWVSN